MYYRAARKKALSNGDIFHIAALLFRRGKLVTIGVNSVSTRSNFFRFYTSTDPHHKNGSSCLAHAEMMALEFANPGDELRVVRWRRDNGERSVAKPCVHCQRRIDNIGGIKVYYTNSDGEWAKL